MNVDITNLIGYAVQLLVAFRQAMNITFAGVTISAFDLTIMCFVGGICFHFLDMLSGGFLGSFSGATIFGGNRKGHA